MDLAVCLSVCLSFFLSSFGLSNLTESGFLKKHGWSLCQEASYLQAFNVVKDNCNNMSCLLGNVKCSRIIPSVNKRRRLQGSSKIVTECVIKPIGLNLKEPEIVCPEDYYLSGVERSWGACTSANFYDCITALYCWFVSGVCVFIV